MNVTYELKWAKRFFNLDAWETMHFEKYLIDCCDQSVNFPIAKKRGSFPNPESLEDLNVDNMILLIVLYRIYYLRLLEYAHYFTPINKLDLMSPEINKVEENLNAPDVIDILEIDDIGDNDILIGDFLSDLNKEFKTLFYKIDNANEIAIKLKDDKLILVRISSEKSGTYIINDSHLKILNDLRNEGNEFLAEIKGSTFFENKEKFEGLKKVFIPFYDEKEKLVFGHKKNSMKKDFVLSLYPLFRCIDERFREQSSMKFKSYTRREIYRYIINLLEIPESILSEYDLEQYFKEKFRIKNKTPDSELPF